MEATAEERRANGFCRYYIRGECREGNHCRFSHDSRDVPVCHYYQEGRCLFGKDCWYNHPDEQQFMPPVYPSLAVLDVGVVRPSSNLNLLLAAAVAGAQTDEDNSSSDEDDLEPLTLDKAMELWMKHKKPKENEAQKEENKNVDAESDDSSEEFGFLEKSVHEFFHELRRYDMTSWNVESVHKLISHLTDLHIKEFDDFNISLSMTLGEVIRLWRQESSQTAELFLRISEKDEADLSSLILTLCNAPVKVKFLEKHIASILTASQRKFPNEWRTEAIAKLLQNVEDNGFNIDATEVFHRMGKEFGDPEVLGKLVRDYLLTNAEKDSFSCRCNTAECECPAIVDEGIAFIVFAGLERKMNWDEEDKLKFFRCATDTLWTPEVLSELGELFNIKDAVNVCHPRVDKRLNWNAKEFVISEDAAGRDKAAQRKLYPQRKCRGLRCSNQPKRGCDFDMCGRCCKKIAEPCSVHEDFSVFEPPVFHGNYSLTKIEPRALFSSKTDLDHLISVTPFRSVTFGSDFSVHDDDVIKIVDLCKDSLVVLELGSSNTGAGVWLSDGAVQHIANYCPNLRKLRLESVTGVTDNAVNDVMTKCPLLEELEVSGHDRSSGSLTDECIKRLFDLSVLPSLKGLIITDQMRVHHDVVYRLRRCRPNLKIIAGETDSDSFAHSMVLSMCGMSYGDGLY